MIANPNARRLVLTGGIVVVVIAAAMMLTPITANGTACGSVLARKPAPTFSAPAFSSDASTYDLLAPRAASIVAKWDCDAAADTRMVPAIVLGLIGLGGIVAGVIQPNREEERQPTDVE
jgi:hypothetical protein